MAKDTERSMDEIVADYRAAADQIEADYREALDEYERLRGPVRERVLELRRRRDAWLEKMDDHERAAWERAHAPAATPDED